MNLLLDLFCGAGGAAMGYHRAGFRVVGVDNEPQPNFPFSFIQADALAVLEKYGHKFDAIHASPPCQAFSRTSDIHGGIYYDYITPVRELLIESGKPYVIENVEGAPLKGRLLKLCGEMFGLGVQRHRIFEANFPLPRIHHKTHRLPIAPFGYSDEDMGMTVVGHFANFDHAKRCMGINWMNRRNELAQAIPPAYTEYIGKHLMTHLTQKEQPCLSMISNSAGDE